MPGDVRLDDEKRLIRVQFYQDSTIEDWRRALLEVQRLSNETGILRVLVDVRQQVNLSSTMDLHDFACHLPPTTSFAVLCELHVNHHRFIESVAYNHGKRVRDFSSEHDAIAWLMKWPNKSAKKDTRQDAPSHVNRS
jgi:hypothetical protein